MRNYESFFKNWHKLQNKQMIKFYIKLFSDLFKRSYSKKILSALIPFLQYAPIFKKHNLRSSIFTC